MARIVAVFEVLVNPGQRDSGALKITSPVGWGYLRPGGDGLGPVYPPCVAAHLPIGNRHLGSLGGGFHLPGWPGFCLLYSFLQGALEEASDLRLWWCKALKKVPRTWAPVAKTDIG